MFTRTLNICAFTDDILAVSNSSNDNGIIFLVVLVIVLVAVGGSKKTKLRAKQCPNCRKDTLETCKMFFGGSYRRCKRTILCGYDSRREQKRNERRIEEARRRARDEEARGRHREHQKEIFIHEQWKRNERDKENREREQARYWRERDKR